MYRRNLTLTLTISLLLLLVACGRGGPSGEYLTTYFEVPAGTAALDATLSYDPAALEYLGAASTQEQVMVEANAHAERVKLASITLSPEGKRLAFVTFKVKQGGSEPSLQSASAYTSAGTPLGRVTVRSERSEQDLAANYRTPASLTSQAVSAQDLDLQASFAERLLGDVIPDNDSNPSNDLNSVDALGVLQLAAGALSAPSDLQLYLADLDTSGTVNSIDAQISLLKAADGDLDATLRATPDALQLEVGETGLILAGNAGNAPLTLALPQVDGVTITQVGGIANQTAAYEVTPGSAAQSGLIVLDAGSAGRRSVTMLVKDAPSSLPTITLTTPADGATLTGDSVDLFWNIELLESDDHVHVYVDGEKKEGSVDPKAPYTLDFADKNIEPGQRVLEVRVSDALHTEYTNPKASDSITVTLEAAPATGDVLYRVNAGGPELAAADGSAPAWSKDSTAAVGSTNASPYLTAGDAKLYNDGIGSAYKGDVTMSSTLPASVPSALFSTERYDPASPEEMAWAFPVAVNQTVEVRLFFAEIFSGVDAAGQRVFDVAVEGDVPPAFNDIDPFATAGAKGAFMRSHTLTVTDGTLNIDFLHDVIENPAIKGIEIVTSDGSASNVPPQVQTIPNQTSVEGDGTEDYLLSISANDADNGPSNLTYSATGLPSGVQVEPTNGQIFGTIAAGAAANSPYTVTVTVSDGANIDQTSFTWAVSETASGNPAALIKVNANAGLFASTYGDNSFQISNTGDSNIERITINASTSFLPDVVFDPVGKAGDNGAKCLTTGSAGNTAAQVGLIYPANGGSDAADCVDPFSEPHNGANDEEGYDKLDLVFTAGDGFNPGESFAFGVDMDPTSIKGDGSTGDAGSISGFELIGATVTVEFANGTVTSSLWEEGSSGGSQVVVAPGAPSSLVISAANVSGSQAEVSGAAQTITLSGPANATVTLLRADARLYIDAGGGGYDIDPFEANEVLAKQLYTTTLNGSGNGSVNVTLTQTSSPNAGPDAGLNHFIAVAKGSGAQTSLTSNVIVLDYRPETGGTEGDDASGAFVEENGLVVIEMESGNFPSGWASETVFSNFTGSSYLRYDGNNHFNNPGVDVITYKVNITKTGTYRFQWRSAFGAGNNGTEHNDSWLKIESDSFYGKQGSGIVCPKGYNSSENSCVGSAPEGGGGGGWFKVYRSGGSVGSWSWTANTSDNDAHQIYADFSAPGTYTISVSGRSAEHAVDRMVLYHSSVNGGAATSLSNPESPREQ